MLSFRMVVRPCSSARPMSARASRALESWRMVAGLTLRTATFAFDSISPFRIRRIVRHGRMPTGTGARSILGLRARKVIPCRIRDDFSRAFRESNRRRFVKFPTYPRAG